MHRDAAGTTDRGLRRGANEDAYLLRRERGLFAVADGMGGHAAGEVASAIAVETLEACFLRSRPRRTPDSVGSALARAVAAANRAIFEAAEREPERAGMGTTLTALALLPDRDAYAIAHVGDSRAYLLRGGELTQLTRDHTWVQQQVDQGLLSPAQARRHPASSVLTRALGSEEDVEVDVLTGALEPADLLLLCSDGLTGMVEDADLLAILASDAPLDELAARLVEAANLRGGWDNITAVLIRAAA